MGLFLRRASCDFGLHLLRPDQRAESRLDERAALYLGALNVMVNKVAGGPKRFIYASLDQRARLIARIAMSFGGDGPHRDVMLGILSEWWTGKEAAAIADKLTRIALDIDLPLMGEKRRKAAAKHETIAQGELAIAGGATRASLPLWDGCNQFERQIIPQTVHALSRRICRPPR